MSRVGDCSASRSPHAARPSVRVPGCRAERAGTGRPEGTGPRRVGADRAPRGHRAETGGRGAGRSRTSGQDLDRDEALARAIVEVDEDHLLPRAQAELAAHHGDRLAGTDLDGPEPDAVPGPGPLAESFRGPEHLAQIQDEARSIVANALG